MALDATKFVTYPSRSGGPAEHFYQTADAVGDVVGSGYFNGVTSRVNQFDTIHVITSTGGTPAGRLLFVTSATGATTVTTAAYVQS